MKKFTLPIISILAILVSLFIYNYSKSLKYDYYIGKANLYLSQKNYNSALESYEKAAFYKNDSEVKAKIKTSAELKESKVKYDTAVSLIGNKQYEKAIEIFKSISQFDGAKNKIEECTSLICNEKIGQAKNYIGKENFQQAKLILQDVLSLNSENAEAKNLIKACDDSAQNKIEEDNRKELLKTIKGVYKLLVDLESQHVYIYKYNKLLKTMLCSSGMDGYETPKGKFTITDRGDYFYSDKYNEGACYWVRFHGVYLFHSVPCDENKNIIKSEADKLGEKASHGCVRLSTEDAKWIYDNITKRISKVLVY